MTNMEQDPDKMFEEYMKNRRFDDHITPAPETVRFMEMQSQFNEKIRDDISDIKVSLQRIEDVGINTFEQAKKTNGRVNRLEEFSPMLEEIKEERKSTKINIRGIFWDIVRAVAIGVVAAIALKYFNISIPI